MNTRAEFLRKAFALIAAGSLVAAAAATVLPHASWRLSYDPQSSGCLPWTLYIARLGPVAVPRKGELVILRQGDLEKAATLEFAQDKAHPLETIPPAVKYVAGLPGDTVEIKEDGIWVNGQYVGKLWLKPWVEKTFPDLSQVWTSQETTIPEGQVLVLGTEPLAFDGRYFGLIPQSDIIGRAWPL